MPKETIKKQKERAGKILNILSGLYPGAQIALNYRNPFELLVATILSAQCTDERVNIVTKELFKKYRTIEDYRNAARVELERDIYSTGFYKNKAKNLKGAAEAVLDNYGGDLPGNMEELLKIPGVGRKTANVVLGHAFDTPGIVVDTHVTRISNRLGFAATKNAEKIEFHLMKILPKEKWVIFTHYIINHGRAICKARKPACAECAISEYCPSAFSNEK